MKKYLLLALLFVSTLSYSQIYTYRATSFASRVVYYGYWTDWTDWEHSNVKIIIDSNSDIITIYSKEPQIYYVREYLGKTTDNDGGTQIHWIVRDQEYLKGKIRLRKELNGNLQLYVEYSDVMWVYNIKRI